MAKQRRILFVALTDDVGANRIVGGMAAAGLSCAVMSPPDFVSARSRLIEGHFALPRQRGLWFAMLAVPQALERACQSWSPDWVVPLDDMAAWQLRCLVSDRRMSSGVRGLLRRSLGAEEGYAAAVSRARLMEVAAAERVRTPRTMSVGTIAAAHAAASAIGYPLMLKLENTCGGAGVFPVAGSNDLEIAMTSVGLGDLRIMKQLRLAAKSVVWRRAGLDVTIDRPAALQERIDGRLALRTVAAVEGRVLAGATFLAVAVHPEPTGASTVLKPFDNREIEAAAAKITAVLGASGFLSFDFIVTTDGRAFLIELNARPVGSTHLGALFGRDICGALAAHISGTRIPSQSTAPSPDLEIALFPKELERDPASPRLAAGSSCWHDVPWEDGPVVDAYVDRLLRLHPTRKAEIHAAMRRSDGRLRTSPTAVVPPHRQARIALRGS